MKSRDPSKERAKYAPPTLALARQASRPEIARKHTLRLCGRIRAPYLVRLTKTYAELSR